MQGTTTVRSPQVNRTCSLRFAARKRPRRRRHLCSSARAGSLTYIQVLHRPTHALPIQRFPSTNPRTCLPGPSHRCRFLSFGSRVASQSSNHQLGAGSSTAPRFFGHIYATPTNLIAPCAPCRCVTKGCFSDRQRRLLPSLLSHKPRRPNAPPLNGWIDHCLLTAQAFSEEKSGVKEASGRRCHKPADECLLQVPAPDGLNPFVGPVGASAVMTRIWKDRDWGRLILRTGSLIGRRLFSRLASVGGLWSKVPDTTTRDARCWGPLCIGLSFVTFPSLATPSAKRLGGQASPSSAAWRRPVAPTLLAATQATQKYDI